MWRTELNAIRQVIQLLDSEGAKKATKYLAGDSVVKATRIGRINKRNKSTHIRLTFGCPNYAERAFIRSATKAGEPFPIRKVHS